MSEKRKDSERVLDPSEMFRMAMRAMATGDSAAVEQNLEKLLKRKSDHLEGLNMMSNLLLERGDDAKAEPYLSVYATMMHQDAQVWRRLGFARARLGMHEEALEAFSKAIALEPDETDALVGMAKTLEVMGRRVEALNWHVNAFRYARRNFERRQDLVKLFSDPNVYQSPLFEEYHINWAEALVDLIQDPHVEPETLVWPAIGQLLALAGQKKNPSSDLFYSFLTENDNIHAGLEQMIVAHRRQVLMNWDDAKTIDADDWHAAMAIAMQSYRNGYLMAYDAHEAKVLQQISQKLERKKPSRMLIVLAMYESPLGFGPDFLEEDPAKWSDAARKLVKRTISFPLSLLEPAQDLVIVSGSYSESQQALQARYRQAVTGRWVRALQLDGSRVTDTIYDRYVGGASMIERKHQILIAGCGAGRHAIAVSRENRRGFVTAIDLSSHNLIFGRRHAKRMRAGNIRFIQGDLMDLNPEDGLYHRIEADGVLHQCDDPVAALKHLVGLLAPGGILKLGLLACEPRKTIAAARKAIGEMGFSDSLDDVRRLRALLMTDPDYAALLNALNCPDFFEVTAFRDLVFPIVEHTFDLAWIQQMLAKNNLIFQGFESPDQMAERFVAQFGEEASMKDLNHWIEWEQAEPGLLGSRYVFWVTRNDN